MGKKQSKIQVQGVGVIGPSGIFNSTYIGCYNKVGATFSTQAPNGQKYTTAKCQRYAEFYANSLDPTVKYFGITNPVPEGYGDCWYITADPTVGGYSPNCNTYDTNAQIIADNTSAIAVYKVN